MINLQLILRNIKRYTNFSPRPKLVEGLLGHRVIDVACGSGDAQTLCVTDDDSVWSWGDGDYGKLGRGGSEGCRVPVRVDSLQGQAIVKVGGIRI